MHDFCFHHLAWHPQRYPQNVWLPSDVPGFDGGFGTPVGLFLWRVLIRSKNRDGVGDIYIPDRITYPPFFGFGFNNLNGAMAPTKHSFPWLDY